MSRDRANFQVSQNGFLWICLQNIALKLFIDSELLIFNIQDLESSAKKNPALFDLYVLALKENLSIIGYRLESMILLSPEERYKELLEKYPQLFQTAFNKHIANFLGITPVSFSRMLKRLKDNP